MPIEPRPHQDQFALNQLELAVVLEHAGALDRQHFVDREQPSLRLGLEAGGRVHGIDNLAQDGRKGAMANPSTSAATDGVPAAATIRRAGPGDAEALAAIGQATFTETFGHLYPPDGPGRLPGAGAHSRQACACADLADPAKAAGWWRPAATWWATPSPGLPAAAPGGHTRLRRARAHLSAGGAPRRRARRAPAGRDAGVAGARRSAPALDRGVLGERRRPAALCAARLRAGR